ncbi:MAG: methylase domain protein [Thermoleophilia bacterium]|nr:methylase domain protein [Thermoleophilia bacterium]
MTATGIARTCVTSPPYWGLRDYGVDGQIGLEPTLTEFIDSMVDVFRAVRRVLTDDGTIWVNMGDSYAGKQRGEDVCFTDSKRLNGPGANQKRQAINRTRRCASESGLKPKDLVGQPWRLALALQDDGWILRTDIVWEKPDAMPESVLDRPSRSHEFLFLLAKSPRYFYDGDAIREPFAPGSIGRVGRPGSATGGRRQQHQPGWKDGRRDLTGETYDPNPRGRAKRTVWTVPTSRFPGAHFATFPLELITPCILAGTSARGQCPKCSAPWRRIARSEVDSSSAPRRSPLVPAVSIAEQGRNGRDSATFGRRVNRVTEGWEPTCACDAGAPVPDLVLDPFMGSGTTAAVARLHGRRAIGIDLNADYLRIAAERLAQQSLLTPEAS